METYQCGTDSQDRRPLILENIKTYKSLLSTHKEKYSLRRNIRVINFCDETHFGRFKRVVMRDFNINIVSCTYTIVIYGML